MFDTLETQQQVQHWTGGSAYANVSRVSAGRGQQNFNADFTIYDFSLRFYLLPFTAFLFGLRFCSLVVGSSYGPAPKTSSRQAHNDSPHDSCTRGGAKNGKEPTGLTEILGDVVIGMAFCRRGPLLCFSNPEVCSGDLRVLGTCLFDAVCTSY